VKQVKANCTFTIKFQCIFTFPKALAKDSPPVEPGLLIAEEISWKSLKPRNLVLKIHTHATKAMMVRLPVGYGLTTFLHLNLL
jgi:hypothetical protein